MTRLAISCLSLLSLSLAGCAVSGQAGGGLGGASAVQLHQPLTVETGWARSFVQHGRPAHRAELGKFDPFCSFEVKEVAGEGDRIEVNPDTFTITRVTHKQPVGGVFAGALNIEEDVGPVEPAVDIYLSSAAQPGVIRLRCSKWESDALFATRVDLDDIRAVLGPVADIR